jgi:hypothetical protein
MSVMHPLWLLGLLAIAPALVAQTAGSDARYDDPDPAAQHTARLDPRDRHASGELEQLLRREPGNIPARVQMARLWHDRGNSSRAASEFQRAIAAAEPGDRLSRYARTAPA